MNTVSVYARFYLVLQFKIENSSFLLIEQHSFILSRVTTCFIGFVVIGRWENNIQPPARHCKSKTKFLFTNFLPHFTYGKSFFSRFYATTFDQITFEQIFRSVVNHRIFDSGTNKPSREPTSWRFWVRNIGLYRSPDSGETGPRLVLGLRPDLNEK